MKECRFEAARLFFQPPSSAVLALPVNNVSHAFTYDPRTSGSARPPDVHVLKKSKSRSECVTLVGSGWLGRSWLRDKHEFHGVIRLTKDAAVVMTTVIKGSVFGASSSRFGSSLFLDEKRELLSKEDKRCGDTEGPPQGPQPGLPTGATTGATDRRGSPGSMLPLLPAADQAVIFLFSHHKRA